MSRKDTEASVCDLQVPQVDPQVIGGHKCFIVAVDRDGVDVVCVRIGKHSPRCGINHEVHGPQHWHLRGDERKKRSESAVTITTATTQSSFIQRLLVISPLETLLSFISKNWDIHNKPHLYLKNAELSSRSEQRDSLFILKVLSLFSHQAWYSGL